MRPLSGTTSTATLLNNYEDKGNANTGVSSTTQAVDVYTSLRHRNFGPTSIAGNPIAQSLPALGAWVTLAFAPVTTNGITVAGSDLNYSFNFSGTGTQPFIPFTIDAGTTYVAPTFIPLVQDPDLPFLRERPFANNSSDASAGALPLLDANGKLDLSLFENTPQTVVALATENIAAGQPVNIYDNAGVTEVRVADSSLDRIASGYVITDVVNGNTVDVYLDGVNELTGLLGLAVATVYYLGPAGSFSTVRPTTSGHFVQRLGKTTSADVLVWEADEYVTYLL